MKKIVVFLSILFLTGCSVVRINTKSIDNIVDVVLSKHNTSYNRIGNGYKYYVPRGVTYIESNDFNDELYCNGNQYYLYIDAVSYYNKINNISKKIKDAYYYRKISNKDFKYNGYLVVTNKSNLYQVEFVYGYARFETVVSKEDLNQTILNASYILSTIKFNKEIVGLTLDADYFTNKESKYADFNSNEKTTKFQLKTES